MTSCISVSKILKQSHRCENWWRCRRCTCRISSDTIMLISILVSLSIGRWRYFKEFAVAVNAGQDHRRTQIKHRPPKIHEYQHNQLHQQIISLFLSYVISTQNNKISYSYPSRCHLSKARCPLLAVFIFMVRSHLQNCCLSKIQLDYRNVLYR